MNVTDYADVINGELNITNHHNQNKRWSADFDGAEIEQRGHLLTHYCNGNTPRGALENYLEEIRGKTIVFDAASGNRLEYLVPNNLTID